MGDEDRVIKEISNKLSELNIIAKDKSMNSLERNRQFLIILSDVNKLFFSFIKEVRDKIFSEI